VVLADCLGTAAEFASAARTGNRPNGSAELAAEGNHAYLLDPPRLTARSDRCDGGKRSAPDARHNGRAVFGFADGHAITQRVDRMGYRQSADGAFRIDDPESTNRFFSGSGRDDDPPAIGG
jgi:prepilin-type processing-associated H-X9-DG protein